LEEHGSSRSTRSSRLARLARLARQSRTCRVESSRVETSQVEFEPNTNFFSQARLLKWAVVGFYCHSFSLRCFAVNWQSQRLCPPRRFWSRLSWLIMMTSVLSVDQSSTHQRRST